MAADSSTATPLRSPARRPPLATPQTVEARTQTVDARTLPVSVIIPAYNRAEMLRRALVSVFSQRPAVADEVIVVDDGSGDDTAQVAAAMGATVIRHPRNMGLSAARNTGLREARQTWIALLDSDDEWLPHHLAGLWELRAGHVLVSGSAVHCGADPSADRFAGPVTRAPVVLRSGDRLVYPSNMIPVSASMFRRELALDVGGFRPHRGVVEDFDMWLRLLERGSAVCSPRVSVIYHVHAAQMSAQDSRAMQLAHEDAAEAHIRRVGGSRIPLVRAQAVAAWDNLGDAFKARRYRPALGWALYIAARPQRVIGLAGILAKRFRVRRRSAALRSAGVGRGG